MNKERMCITLAPIVRTEMDKLCDSLQLKESTYIEMLIRADIRKRKIITETPKIYKLEDWWDERDDPKLKFKKEKTI